MPDLTKVPRRWSGQEKRSLTLSTLAVTLASTFVFFFQLPRQPHFVDESAYVSQSFYFDLWWGDEWNDPSWLEYAAYDLPPLPKYLIGAGLHLAGLPRPSVGDAHAWYANTSFRSARETPLALVVARAPSAILGGLGCAAIFLIGHAAGGLACGWISALLLMSNPLYFMHARRAMSDAPAEAFLLLALAWLLPILRSQWTGVAVARSTLYWVFGVGLLGGLAVLSKLNGLLAFISAGVMVAVLMLAPGRPWSGKALAILAWSGSLLIGFALQFTMNPFLTSQPRVPLNPNMQRLREISPVDRFGELIRHRWLVSKLAAQQFPHNAVDGLAMKVKVMAVQGFGRFGPLGPRESDSTRRFDFSQDWGAILWLPLVTFGGFHLFSSGLSDWRQGEPPMPWFVLAHAITALVVVTWFLPLAWDRYFLSVQAGSSVLAASALCSWLRPRSPS